MIIYAPIFNTRLEAIKFARDFIPMSFGQTIFFGKGNKDNWCAWIGIITPDGVICAKPSDKYYFGLARDLGAIHGADNVFLDLFRIYSCASDKLDQKVIDMIFKLSTHYGQNHEWALNMFLHVYYGMVAEEHYENTKLGSLIKINGLYDVLLDGATVEHAADCHRGGEWVNIKEIADSRHLFKL